jgi:hypothetical protein
MFPKCLKENCQRNNWFRESFPTSCDHVDTDLTLHCTQCSANFSESTGSHHHLKSYQIRTMSVLNANRYEFRLYPPVQQAEFISGTPVYIRATNHTRGLATVVCPPEDGRVLVTQSKGVQAAVRVNRCTQVCWSVGGIAKCIGH